MYCLFCDVPCIVCVYVCTEQLPPGGYPIAVKYISYHMVNKTGIPTPIGNRTPVVQPVAAGTAVELSPVIM